MGKKILILLESPGKIKKIDSIFNSFKDGNSYTVMASMGHISKIADTGIYHAGIDLTTFEETYEILSNKKDIVKKLKKAVKNADLVYLASDADREGEAIAFHWKNFLKIPKKKYKRVIFKEITEKGIKEGLAAIKDDINDNEVQAARARAEIDKLVGYRLSPFSFSQLHAKSAGRVQSAALKIICDKENEILSFKLEIYYELWLTFLKDKKEYKAQYRKINKKTDTKIKSKTVADKIFKECKSGNYEVKTITPKERISNPKNVFTTSTLQQTASTILGYAPKRTMGIAQQLYENGLITYMRTDSIRLSNDFIKECKKTIEKKYGKEYYKGFTSKVSDSAQDGHEGIRMTHLEDTPEKLSIKLKTDELKLYKLIYNRTLASLMSAAKIEDLEIGIFNKENNFFLTGHTVLFDGYLKVYSDSENEDNKLPIFKINEKIKDKKLDLLTKSTQPPNRFSEAGIIRTLESSGIGRPSTFAPTIETLKNRRYITVETKTIFPTELGMKLSFLLDQYFSSFINTKYTSEMENALDKISVGKISRFDELKKFWEEFNPLVLKANRELAKINKNKPKPQVSEKKCPKCKKNLVIRKSSLGKEFLACSGYPRCRYTESLEKKKTTYIKTDYLCPKCEKGNLVQRKSKKTNELFYGCSKFIEGCKFTMKEEEFKKLSSENLKKKKISKEN